MQKRSFKLCLKEKVYTLTPFENLMKISSNITDALIFNSQHQYQVESNVSNEVFEAFINYLTNEDVPDINISNINEFILLSDEFHILEEIITQKKNEFGFYLVNLNGLHESEDNNKHSYEKEIAKNLDEYLSKYGFELMKSPIQSLYNIFNHQERNLTKHDLAYELICDNFKRTNNSNVFILLDTLDGSKLARNNLIECFSLFEERCNHMPKIDFSYLAETFERQIKLEERIFEVENKLEDEIRKSKEKEEEFQQEKIKLEQKHEIDIDSLNIRIQNLQTMIEQNSRINQEMIENKYKEEKETLEKAIEQLKQQLAEAQESNMNAQSKISTLEEHISFDTKNFINCHSFRTEISKNYPGILSILRTREKTPFHHLFIASQSSNDIYNIIDPQTEDDFCSVDVGNCFEIELEEAVNINGVKIFSSFKSFPKSFKIVINDQDTKSILNATELNGKNQEMTISIDQILCKKVQFIQNGPNWDLDTNFLRIKRIELISPESKYSNGVFATLVSKYHDPHKCPLNITSQSFSLETFQSIDSPKNICTYGKSNSWFQIEFTRGTVVLDGFRLTRCDPGKIKSFKIICTNDINKQENEWTTLIEIEEQTKEDHQVLDTYEFKQPSPPVKYVRLIQTGPNWSNDTRLKFYHLDFFGNYY